MVVGIDLFQLTCHVGEQAMQCGHGVRHPLTEVVQLRFRTLEHGQHPGFHIGEVDALEGFVSTQAGALCQGSHLIGYHRKPLARFAGMGRLYGGVERQQMHRLADVVDAFDHLPGGAGLLFQQLMQGVKLGGEETVHLFQLLLHAGAHLSRLLAALRQILPGLVDELALLLGSAADLPQGGLHGFKTLLQVALQFRQPQQHRLQSAQGFPLIGLLVQLPQRQA